MLMKLKEMDGIETVGDLFNALDSAPKDMQLGDLFGDPLHLALVEDGPDGPFIAFN